MAKPYILVSELAALKLRYAAEAMPNHEVSGFGRVRVLPDNAVEVIDIVIPPQEVGGAHVDISPAVRDAFYTEVVRNGCQGENCERTQEEARGRDQGWAAAGRKQVECNGWHIPGENRPRATHLNPDGEEAYCDACLDFFIHQHDTRCGNGDIKEWRLWWHKHPGKTKPSPSGVDTNTLEEFAGVEGFNYGWMLGIIIPSDGDENYYAWMTNGNGPWMVEQRDIDVYYARPDRPKIRKVIEAQMANVKVRTYATTPTTPYRGTQQSSVPVSRPVQNAKEIAERRGAFAEMEHKANNFDALVHLKGVKDVQKSATYPGSIEITKDDGTVIVTKDAGQLKEWEDGKVQREAESVAAKAANAPDSGLQGRKVGDNAPDKVAKKVKQHVREEGIRWVGQGTAATLRSRDGTIIIGFDLNGEPLMEEEERYCYYVLDHKLKPIVADVKVRRAGMNFDTEGNLIPSPVDMAIIDTMTAHNQPLIGFDCEGLPLTTGDDDMLCYGPDGKPTAQGAGLPPLPATTVAQMRERYLIPHDVADEDVPAYVQMRESGGLAVAMAGFGGYAHEFEEMMGWA